MTLIIRAPPPKKYLPKKKLVQNLQLNKVGNLTEQLWQWIKIHP